MNEINQWFRVKNADKISSPAILIYPDRIERNIIKMIEIAGSASRLQPHVKTHKMPEVVKLQMKHGITKFKCSTIAELEMTAGCGAADILLAMQPVGPSLERFFNVKTRFPQSSISCLADNESDISRISEHAIKNNSTTEVWLDINAGMNRTGIIPGESAIKLYKQIVSSPMLVAGGLHVYDGHIHEPDAMLRKQLCSEAFAPVSDMLGKLNSEGYKGVKVIAGGTPSFPIHATYGNAVLSPGTTILWDYGYSQSFKDLDFLHAAILLTRVVSKPAPGLLCLDLGHKAVASEMPHPRVVFPELPDYRFTGHNEEHLVISTNQAERYRTGDILYCIPWHICPTIDRHDKAVVIRNNVAECEWSVEARKRRITI